MRKFVFTLLYGAALIGAEVANYIVIRDFLWPVYGVAAALVALVFGAMWLGSSCSWIWLGRRDAVNKAAIWGSIAVVTLIQVWAGLEARGELGKAVMTADYGQNVYMFGLLVMQHAVLPICGLWAVHGLGKDWPAIDAKAVSDVDPVVVALADLQDTLVVELARVNQRLDTIEQPAAAAPRPTRKPDDGPLADKWWKAVEEHGELPVAELAERAGVSRQAVNAWRKAALNGSA